MNIREYVEAQLKADLRAGGGDVQIGEDVYPIVDRILYDLDSYL